MYKLYYKPGACSMAVHVLLNELAVPFETVKQDDLKSPEFLKLNPRGQVPVLVIDGEPVKEGGALLSWLCDEHDSELLPDSGLERAKALEWLMWCNATLHPASGKMFWLGKAEGLDTSAKESLKKIFTGQLQALWDEAEARLSKNKYLAGEAMTVGDILLTVIANWGLPVTLGSNVRRLIKEVSQRPAYQKALKIEEIEYKAAA